MSVKKLTAQRLRQIVMEEAAAMRAPRKSTKLTESRLRQIIREELNQINESLPGTHAIWSEPAGGRRSNTAPYYEFYFTGKGDIALRDAGGNDKEDELENFCSNHNCMQNEVATVLSYATDAEARSAATDDDLDFARRVLENLKNDFPGAVFNGQQISKLSIS